MGKKLSLPLKIAFSLATLGIIGLVFLGGCATMKTEPDSSAESEIPIIESLTVKPSPEQTVIEVLSSRSASYTAFKLVEPLRVVLDVRGKAGALLKRATVVRDGNVKAVLVQEGKTQTMTTRLIVALEREVDYEVQAKDESIVLTLIPQTKKKMTGAAEPQEKTASTVQAGKKAEEPKVVPQEPRIFFEPKAADLSQVVGIDFTMLERGKSRVTVTTDKHGRYDLVRTGPKDLSLKLPDTTIPPQLLREIDSSHFKGAVDRIKPAHLPDKKQVDIAMNLREMVPFHIKQSAKQITIDFGQTSVKPVEKKIVPLQLAQAQAQQPASAPAPGQPSAQGQQPAPLLGGQKKYSGTPMYLDFANADVTNILRLINEVSKENIIWDPQIAGRKVSMVLKGVPWDQALDLILKNNNLARRSMGPNIIWITTKQKMDQILGEEKAKADAIKKAQEEKAERARQAKVKAKKEEPLTTEYIAADFANADEIQGHVEAILSKRGKVSVDVRTNTMIITDISGKIEEARNIVKRFDTPVKQVMIEARIVDATSSFTRDLGVQWKQFQVQRRPSTFVPWTAMNGTPGTVNPVDPTTADFPYGGNLYSPTFTSNTPDKWAGNLGMAFSKLGSFGLSSYILNLQIALAETEGEAKVISAPKVIASNGEEATIASGESIIIPATENVESTTIDATLSLTVTPTVSYNNYVTMVVTVTNDEAPTIAKLTKRSVTTSLMVKSGETLVIGGIFKETKGEDVSGIPGLKDIPLLGWLFKAEKKTVTRSELLIFLTPTVLPVESAS
ncbi:type IV pilus secretin PilQ [Thermodesulfobacteriota bacterium]